MTKDNNSTISQFQLLSENWAGCIPIVLSLAPTSLSSPNMPCSLHVLVSRHTFLHVGLQEAILRLYKFAPVSFSSNIQRQQEPSDDEQHEKKNHVQQQEQSFPTCWFQDEDTQFALRWHLFVGVLWDLKQHSTRRLLPWKITLHFTNYPSSQILPLDNIEAVQQSYMNSLKQALFLQYNSNKVAMKLSKQSHGQLWDAIVTHNCSLYHQIDLPMSANNVSLLPIRILVGDTKPPIQRPCRIANGDEQITLPTLGSVLAEWCPNLFCVDESGTVTPMQDANWIIQGIFSIELSTSVVDLWQSLASPDHFLYIIVSTNKQ